MWKTTGDLLSDIYDTRAVLLASKDVEMAHAECRLYNAAIKVVAVGLESARLSGALGDGGIPSVALAADKMAKALPTSKVKALPKAK